MPPGFSAANRANWDERVGIHSADATGAYRMAALRAGDNSLHPIEDRELGEVMGKRLVHLQCHFGRDTLALARRGAAVTGLDFSPEAIRTARHLAAELNIGAEFVEGEVENARFVIPAQAGIPLGASPLLKCPKRGASFRWHDGYGNQEFYGGFDCGMWNSQT